MCSPELFRALEAAGWAVHPHTVLFPNEGEKPDSEWIPIVAAQGLLILTSDRKMRHWRTEGGEARKAIISSRAKVLFLKGVEARHQSEAVMAAANSINRFAKRHAGTYAVARVHSQGSRLGEVMLLECGGNSKTEQRLGVQLATTAEPDDLTP